ncbi:tRNA lysidine(34) synthetase TilS [Buchnera aphidicola]|uniref:tRNA(Ile)-lysidine synthase n=1 Tax=Buchnera aphidicola (Sarucallis kahawaluokalani) TaxID=1241878 RepID=A0A4D6YLQ2_9GAMM|nr:tRNA lysidine(34) synthetase TilS [Buchnera aphidicola]QCI25885.1 tRNA lysidine(34) synthetase TilS [Buchnera aphidicola (Sarucallis kahawaluokalani)]
MIHQFIKNIPKKTKILISYSGGLDSTVLLHKLLPFRKKYPFLRLRAIHINHQINKHSRNWVIHCQNTCQKNNIELIVQKIQFKTKNNFQNNARELRYKIILHKILPNEILVTGHHSNDQCETLFLSLKRGSGITGLSGIKYQSNLSKKIKIIRPLLKYQKQQLQSWAIKNHLHWIEDNSNFTNKYDRNFIRNTILSKIQKKWPFFIKNCNRSMKLFYQQEKSHNYFLDNIINQTSVMKNDLNIKKICIYPTEIWKLLIRRWIILNMKNTISYTDTKNIYKMVINQNKYITYKINTQNINITKYKNKIFYLPEYPKIKNQILFWHDYTTPLKLPQNLGYITQSKYGTSVPKPKKFELINIRFQINKIIHIHNIKKRRKNIWNENKITPWNRNRIPCLFYDNTLIAIMGVLIIPQTKKINTWKISWINYVT